MGSTPGTRTERKASRRNLRVLFTCIGRRVALLKGFRSAAKTLGVRLETHGADASMLAPAMHLVDQTHIVPPIASTEYVETLLAVVERCSIDLLIPLIDTELSVLADSAGQFTDRGCIPLISTKSVIDTCQDKLATHKVLKAAGIDTPATWTWKKVLERKRHRFPYFMKPREGSAAQGNHVITNVRELRTFGRRVNEPIVQEFVEGTEHTLDVYTGFDGKPRCVVPRRRLEVRMGEVSKGLIVKDRAIMASGRKVARVLGGCRGVVTVQCMVTPQRRIRVIEINPRFGGGVPLAIHAGADFPLWILTELLGRKPSIDPTGFQDDVCMLRFDDAVFVENASRVQSRE